MIKDNKNNKMCHQTWPRLAVDSTAPDVRKQQRQHYVVGQRQRYCRASASQSQSFKYRSGQLTKQSRHVHK